MNRITMKLIPLIIIFSFFGCSKDSSTSPNTCDTSYSGTWALTSTGSYENGDCTGDLTVGTIDDGSIYLVLSDDCTATSYDTMFCSEPSEEADLCINDWYAQDEIITIMAFGGFMPVEYIVDGNKMATTIIAEYTVNDSSWTQCSYSEYSKQ